MLYKRKYERVQRGRCWQTECLLCPSYRFYSGQRYGNFDVGFRVVLGVSRCK